MFTKFFRVSAVVGSAAALLGALVLVVTVVRDGTGSTKSAPRFDPVRAADAAAGGTPGGPPSATAAPATSGPATPAPSTEAPAPRSSGGGALPGAIRPGSRPPVVDHGPRTGNLVALTFDADMTDAMLRNLRDGRARSYANLRIVELLERRRVPATFFLTGKWVQRYPELTRRLAGNPRFELANHTYGHLAFTPDCYGLPRLPPGRMTEDVARTFRLIEPYGGRQTRYFRFPGLCHDAAALAALAPLGVTVVDGDVVSGDPFAGAWRPIVKAVLSQVRPGSVVVLHVTEENAAMTDEALPHILAGLRDRGLRPATLSEVLSGG
ncbi:polysaccharide deacetylase family protein [Micromonospora sp. WMMD1102]|uniref:polysaccharide deacetylase family protein n=1 Tax=Micromonospora sp. WMMD1102 TaxID=3016105 RepID=UPI002414FEC7|nr:polysaccharide deacetylase family protein [Micromonospora sp. WMMD1102]MDG4789599.1 polysaccharide deacetylase family protein [Micromonospora sp. WMMD1102]